MYVSWVWTGELTAHQVSQTAADLSEEKAAMEQGKPNANPKTKWVTAYISLNIELL